MGLYSFQNTTHRKKQIIIKKPVIYLIIPNLCQGGAENVMSFLASNLRIEGFDIRLIVCGHRAEAIFRYEANTIFLEKKSLIKSSLRLIKLFIHARPRLILSTLTHLNTFLGVLLVLFPSIKFISREAEINIEMRFFDKWKLRNLLRNLSLLRANIVISQSLDMKLFLHKTFFFNSRKSVVIGNPIMCSVSEGFDCGIIDCLNIITVGRLHKIKGHLRLLNILFELSKKRNFHYTIVGKGPEKNEIIESAKLLGIINKISFVEHSENVVSYLSKSDIFIQGSFVEGFPNAVMESLVNMVPVISFNIKGGTKDMVLPNINGFLVDCPSEFLLRLLNFSNKEQFDWQRSNEYLFANFSQDVILFKYTKLINELIKGKQFV